MFNINTIQMDSNFDNSGNKNNGGRKKINDTYISIGLDAETKEKLNKIKDEVGLVTQSKVVRRLIHFYYDRLFN